MSTDTTWHFKVNGGGEQTLSLATTVYCMAVAAIPGVLGTPVDQFPLDIQIWTPSNLAGGYGPYDYRIDEPGSEAKSVNAYVAAVYVGAMIRTVFEHDPKQDRSDPTGTERSE